MKDKKIYIGEFLSAAICASSGVVLPYLYEFTGGELTAAVFFSANHSAWEELKPLMLVYFVCGGLELFALRPRFKSFVTAKVPGMCTMIVFFILLRLLFSSGITAVIVSVCAGYFLSFVLMRSRGNLEVLFLPMCFTLFLIFIMYFSFTVCPPVSELFRDPVTSAYGIIPGNLDRGAVMMSSLF